MALGSDAGNAVADGGSTSEDQFGRHHFPALQSPATRLMSPGILAALHSFAAEPSEEDEIAFVRLARDRRMKSFVPTRKHARILNPIDAPLDRPVPPPSLHLQCDTTSAFLRSLPESRSSPSLFASSVSKHGVCLPMHKHARSSAVFAPRG